MLNFSIDTVDLAKFKVAIDYESMLDESAAFLVSKILTRFLSETDPQGKAWIPSKAGMARRLNGGTGTLFDTGRLFRSIQVHKTAGQRRISTDVPYASKLQVGYGNIPARPFLGFSNDDELMVKQIFQLRLAEMVGS